MGWYEKTVEGNIYVYYNFLKSGANNFIIYCYEVNTGSHLCRVVEDDTIQKINLN